MSSEEFPNTAGLSAEEIELLAYLLAEEGVEAPQPQPIPPRRQHADPPLSYAQERLWFLDQWQPNDPSYIIPVALTLRGRLDLGALRRSLNALVQRHETLRTTFAIVDGRPVQRIAPECAGAALPVIDLRGLPDAPRAAAARALAQAAARTPFDLARGPLVRTLLLRRRPAAHTLVLTLHHSIADGWSLTIVFRELAALYAAFVAGRPDPLAPLPIQYADFALWQRAWLEHAPDPATPAPLQSQLAYWRAQLHDLPTLDLPTDHPRPAALSARGLRQQFAFAPALADDLAALSQRAGVTLFMTLLAAFQALLARYSGQTDLVVGSPIAGRNRAEIEGLIGFFVNTLALRADLAGDPPFTDLLGQLRETTLSAYAHQDVPFEKLVEDLRPQRDLSRTPLFQVSLAVQNTGLRAPDLPDLATALELLDNGAAKFDLALIVEETAGRLAGAVEYRTDLFAAATIARLLEHFATLLAGVVADPRQRLSALPLLTPAERAQLTTGANPDLSRLPAAPSFPELVAAQAARAPDATALVVPALDARGDQHLTYRELNGRANRLASYLRQLGCGPETRVGLCMERGLALVIGMLGALKAGSAYVPLDPDAPSERLGFMLADAGISVLLTQAHLRERLPATTDRMICLDEDWPQIATADAADPRHAPDPASLAYMIYTSGTTGQPKAVLVEHRNLAQLLEASRREFGFAPGVVMPWVAPAVFDITLFELGLPLATGGTALALSREQVLDFPGLLATLTRCTALHCVPSLMQQIVAAIPPERAPAYDGLRAIYVGGETVPPPLLDAIPAAFRRAETQVMYGPTEATILCLSQRIADGRAERPLVGRPLPHAQAFVCDARGQLAPIGVPGELYVGGPAVTRGYLGRPDLTAEKFAPNPFAATNAAVETQDIASLRYTRLYKTGDRVRYGSDGSLEFLGRTDEQVKIRGYRIEPGEIAAAIIQHPSAQDAVVLAHTDAMSETRLVAYVVPSNEFGGTRNEQAGDRSDSSLVPRPSSLGAELRAYLASRLPAYMIPSAFVPLDRLPLTPNGKLDRRALPAPDFAGAEESDAYVAPRTPLEELLASQWAAVLGLPRVSVQASFFDLGGHSLLATQLLVRLRQQLQLALPVRALFDAPSVAAFAGRVRDARRDDSAALPPPLEASADTTPPPLSFAQERLWFLDQLAPGNPFYNTAFAVQLDGRLDLAAFGRTLNAITRRHEALRTTFAPRDGRPIQIIAPPRRLPPPLLDLSALPAARRLAAADHLARTEARRPFDLARGPLIRAALLRLDAHTHHLLLTAHHSVFDGWSTTVFVRELRALYRAFVGGAGDPLPALPLQYADYARWQRAWLQGAALDAQLAFWRTHLRGAPAVLDLPADYPRPATQTYRGARAPLALSAPLAASLRALSGREGSTLFMTLLAGWQALLARHSRQHDVVVGVPIAGRTQAALEGLIGFFVNTLALRGDVSGDPTVAELLARVRGVVLSAYDHQDAPFEMVVEAVQPPRNPSHAPLFQTMLVLQNTPQTDLDLPEVTLTPLEGVGAAALFDLMIGFVESEAEELTGGIVYNADLFAPETIHTLRDQLTLLLEAFCADPQRRLSDLPLLSPAARQQLLAERRAAAAAPDMPAQFAELARRAPDAVALAVGDDLPLQLSYAALDRYADRLARRICAHIDVAGGVVAVGLPPGARIPLALLALLKAGADALILDLAAPAAALAKQIQRARPALLLADERAALPPVDAPTLAFSATLAEGDAPNAAAPPTQSALLLPDPHADAALARMSHAALGAHVSATRQALGLSAASRAMVARPADPLALLPLLLSGATICLPPATSPNLPALPALIDRQAATVALLPDAWLGALSPARLPTLRTLAVLGLGVVPAMLARWATGRAVWLGYGAPAAPGWAPLALGSPAPARLRIGAPLGSAPTVLEADGAPTPLGIPGALHLGGSTLADGYAGQPALTAARFIPDPLAVIEDRRSKAEDSQASDAETLSSILYSLSSGDARLYRSGMWARRLPDGTLELWDPPAQRRWVRGFPVERALIIEQIQRQPEVRESVATARAELPDERPLAAYVVSTDGPQAGAALERTLPGTLRAQLPDYLLPGAIRALERLPRTPDGAIDLGALPPPVDARAADAASPAAATASPQIAVRAANLAARRQDLSAAKQALLEQRLRGKIVRPAAWSPLVAIQPAGSRPPFFCVHPVGGTVICYVELARALGSDQPFYGLQAAGLDGRQPPDASIAAMAERYLAALRTIQPAGPYRIGGWSLGGLIAFEIAQQLRAAGECARLAMIDTMVPNERNLAGAEVDEAILLLGFVRDMAGRMGRPVPLDAETLRAQPAEARMAYAVARARQAQLLPPETDVKQLEGMFAVYKSNLMAMAQYVTQPYPDPALLVRANEELHRSEGDRTLGWGEVLQGPLEIVVTPGSHYTILTPPQVEILADHLRLALAG